MKPRKKSQKRALGQLMSIVGLFLFIGIVLILHVWLPIQAQRALVQLKKQEKTISQKKNILERTNQEYLNLTSLIRLDLWARENGPWKVPNGQDVLTIYE